MSEKNPENYIMELGPMGPIGEGAALMLRVNRNCPWNQCLFCAVYKESKFSSRRVKEIKEDIDNARRIGDLLESTSREMGLAGWVQQEVIHAAIKDHPDIYGEYPSRVTEKQRAARRCLGNLANWFMYGARRVFLQDANALSLKAGALVEVLRYLKDRFPTVDTVTCYARSKTCNQRTPEELKELQDAGLSWCFLGIESGCDEVLDSMKKGVTKAEHISGGQKLMASGIKMAAFVMPGLAGGDREKSRRHIKETLDVLNEIGPTEIRARSLAVLESAPLWGKWEAGEFLPPREDQMVGELRELIEGIKFDCTFETLQMTNLFNFKGQLPARGNTFLEAVYAYQDLPPLERARYLLNRYVRGGYLDFVQAWERLDPTLQKRIEEAERCLEEESPEALGKVEKVLWAIKSKGIP
jgi:histone acetyltransferase (RNA polymerase elongator complex component)